MKLFIHYLKDRCLFIVIYTFSLLTCYVVFKLYNLELEAFTYAFMILCVLLVVCFFWDYHKYYKKHQTLVTLQSNSNVSLSCDLQDSSLMGEDYHKILVAMKDYHDEYVISSESKMHDLEDYFTMWVHQAKLPIAAMKLLLEDENLSRSEIKLQLLRMDQYTDMVLAYLRLNSTHTDFLFKETGDVILSDEKWLVFVLEQILSNSLKYTNENGSISIYMKTKHVLVIEDSGIGISASDLNRVFEKGYTGMNGRSDKTASGLGLYLCKNILDMLNHKITIESSVGKGTRVILDLTHFEGRIE